MKISLKAVLKNFLNHFETLESRRKYNADDDLYQQEFQSMKELTESLKNDVHYSCSHGLKEVNRRKNRYKDILPYDHSRVILSEYPGVPGSDYINANYVRGSTGSSCAYIASQGPLPNTVVDFWRMIWESEVSVIVMACNETESGKYKCECYWPESSDEEEQYGNITVQIVKWRQVCPDFLVRTLKIQADGKKRIVCQFHYTTWPDHGVPNSVQPILELVRLMRDVQASEARPILIHCSAGCGRTGTICSIDYVWALLRAGKLTEDFSLYNIISDMRRQRIAMVQTQEQYMLCYRAVAALFEQQLKMIDAHTYENLDEDGEPLMLSRMNGTTETNHASDKETSSSSESSESDAERDNQQPESQTLSSNHVTTNPNTDVKHLIDAWKISTVCPTTQSQMSSHSLHRTYSTSGANNEVKHEKLVGRATVIRRPSIAKLKALFENRQTSDGTIAQDSHHRVRPLHRSLSTRERGSNGYSDAYHNSRYNNEVTNVVPIFMSRKFNDDTESHKNNYESEKDDFSKYSNYHHPWSSQAHKSSEWAGQTNGSMCSDAIESDKETTGEESQHNGYTNQDMNNCEKGFIPVQPDRSQKPLSSHNSHNDNPPPKPPRTYQYLSQSRASSVAVDHQNQSNHDEENNSNGQMIVSVPASRYEDQRKENLYENLTCKGRLYPDSNQGYYLTIQRMRNASESNIYEPSLPTYPSCRVNKQLSKSSHMLVADEGNYDLIQNASNMMSSKSNYNLNQAPPPQFKTLNLRRDMSVPVLPLMQQPIPPRRAPKSQQQQQQSMQAGLKGPPEMYCRRPPPPRPQNGQCPVTYVRQPGNSNQTNPPRPDQNKPRQLQPTKPAPNGKQSENKTDSRTKESARDKTHQRKTGAVQPVQHQQLQAQSSLTSQQQQLPKTAEIGENPKKKPGSSFASFFGFGKKKKQKAKAKPSTDLPHTQPSNPSNSAPIRPPHSHRFSPPTQWTQV